MAPPRKPMANKINRIVVILFPLSCSQNENKVNPNGSKDGTILLISVPIDIFPVDNSSSNTALIDTYFTIMAPRQKRPTIPRKEVILLINPLSRNLSIESIPNLYHCVNIPYVKAKSISVNPIPKANAPHIYP